MEFSFHFKCESTHLTAVIRVYLANYKLICNNCFIMHFLLGSATQTKSRLIKASVQSKKINLFVGYASRCLINRNRLVLYEWLKKQARQIKYNIFSELLKAMDSLLSLILNSNEHMLPLLLSYLTPEDIEALYVGAMTLFSNLYSIKLMLNCIHYNRYLGFDHSFNLTWGYHPEDCFRDTAAYGRTIVCAPALDLTANKHRVEQIRKILTQSLQKFLKQEHSETTDPIVSDIYESLKEGPLLVPHLRRECIGMNSNTPLQYFYADQLTQEELEINEEFIYEPLRQALTENAEEIEEAALREKSQLLKRRFQSQLTTQFEESPSVLLNLVDAIVLAIDAHVEAVYSIVKAEQRPLERMIYFVSHYVNYRQSLLALNEKLSFVFEELEMVFQRGYPECYYLGNPHFSLAIVMLKKWYARMKEFQVQFAHIYSYLLMTLRWRSLREVIARDQQEQSFSNEFLLRAMKAQPFYFRLESHGYCQQSDDLKDLQEHKDAAKHILFQYTEYLVDLSVNEVTVHLNDHGEQEMGLPYALAENILVEDTLKYYRYIYDSIHDLPILKSLIESDLKLLKTVTKPLTIKKIVVATNELLESIRQSMTLLGKKQAPPAECQLIVVDMTKSNKLIESMLENLKINVSIPEELKELYDITATIDLEKLKTYFENEEGEEDKFDLESYRSQQQVQDMEIQNVKPQIREDSTMSVDRTLEEHKTAGNSSGHMLDESASQDYEAGGKGSMHFLLQLPSKSL